jgi:serine/threonine-protein kinase
MVDEGPRLQIGDVLGGRYRLIGLLGGGGMGIVYLAEDLRVHGRRRAIKEMKHSAGIDRFVEEVRLLSRLSHPCLPQIVDAIEPVGTAGGYIIMDYIHGETLASLFARMGRRLPLSMIVSIAKQVCGIFQYLHEEMDTPIVYRDLKPSNLMIDAQGRVRLIDFGIARFLRPDRPEDTVLLGTPGFAAPEQYAGKSGIRSDLYNLGALLGYLLCGGRNPGQRLKFESSGVPAGLVHIVEKLLAESPEQRYGSAGEVLAALEQFEGELAKRQAYSRRIPLIAVGALYEGAGATFLCEALESAVRRAMQQRRRTLRIGRRHIADMSGGEAPWSAQFEHGFADLLLCDIGSNWHELPEHASPAGWADMIVLAADPIPAGWHRTVTERKLRLAEAWRRQGAAVYWAANRDVPIKGRDAWLSAFPWRPVCMVPALDFVWTAESAWRGARVQDHVQAAPLLDQALRPLSKKIIELLEKTLEKNGNGTYNLN